MVDRYAIWSDRESGECTWIRDDAGAFVRFRDYAVMEAERDALAAQVEALKGWEFMDTGGGAWTIVSPFGDHVLVQDHAGQTIASQMLAMLAKDIDAARKEQQP